ncbi:TPA: hypothetical protein DDW35_11515, partial [Candidatus Sumerlaeota bacterium]|nr:hypothetical protein [Candidatus Sumerlaeota bacterium]
GTIPANGIVEQAEETESDRNGIRVSEVYKVSTTTEVFEGDSVKIRNMTYRVKNILSPTQGVYEFEARR